MMSAAIARIGLADEETIALDHAALEIAAPDHEGISLEPAYALIDEIVVRVAGADTARRRADVMAAVIGDEYGFVGDRETYDDPANADLIRMLDRRKGLPVSLSILYVAVARRLGWPADALDVPSHVLVRIGADDGAVVIDPFAGGAVIGQRDAMARVARLLGGAPVGPRHFAPMSNRAVLVRLLLNQATRAEAGGAARRARTLYQRITLFAPGHTQTWLDLARLDVALGDIAAARGSLAAMLETTRDPARRVEIDGIMAALERRQSTKREE